MFTDLRYAVRSLLKSPAFAVVSLLTIFVDFLLARLQHWFTPAGIRR